MATIGQLNDQLLEVNKLVKNKYGAAAKDKGIDLQQLSALVEEPTAGSVYSPYVAPSVDSEYDDALADAGSRYKRGSRVINEEAIRNNVLSQFQAEIDATNKIYSQKLAEAQQQGIGRLGSSRAVQARSGLMGSDFGAAQTEKVNDLNTGIIDTVRQEQSAAVAAIMGKARQEAAAEIAQKRAAQQESLDSYLNFLSTKAERSNTRLTNLAASFIDQGVDPSTIDPSQIKEIAKQYGTSVDNILASYKTAAAADKIAKDKTDLDTRKAEADISKIEADIASGKLIELSEGAVLYNTETGETFRNPKVFAPKDSDTSVVGLDGSSTLVGQPGYGKLTASQKKQADSINNLIREMNKYKENISTNVGDSGVNVFGADAGLLETQLNSIIFAAAQAEGTGALQAADRAVIEKIIPNPTSKTGAFNAATKGGKKGQITRIEDQINKYTNSLAAYGLAPVVADVAVTNGNIDDVDAFLDSI